MKKIILRAGLLLLFFIGVLSGYKVDNSYAATSQDIVVSNIGYSYSLTLTGNTSNYFQWGYIDLANIIPGLTRDTAITSVKYRVKFNGSDARTTRNPYMQVWLSSYYSNTYGPSGSILSTRYRSDSTVGQWYEYTFNFNPDAGEQISNRIIGLDMEGVDSYDACSWTIELLEVKYRKYSIDVNANITNERYVNIISTKFNPSVDSKIAILNVNDNRWILGNSSSRVSFDSGALQKIATDTGVKPEVTYTYYIYHEVGSENSAFGGTSTLYVCTIKVPSDATYAAQYAADAKMAAENVVGYVNNSTGDTITAVRDTTGTVLQEARQTRTMLNSLQTTITNIQNNLGTDTTPPTIKLKTASGAMATSGGSIQAVLDISDNKSSVFTYSLDGVNYSSLPLNKVISLPVSSPGANMINVWVKDEARNVCSTSITIRKI